MVMDRISELLFGTVRFTVAEGFPDRFLNDCSEDGIVLKNVAAEKDRVSATVPYRRFPAVRETCVGSGMRVISARARGVKPLLLRYKARIGVPIGILAGIFLYLFLSSMLWSIRIGGIDESKSESFHRYLSEIGVSKGMFLINIECNEIERLIEAWDPEILRASVNLIGCKLYIDVKPRVVPPRVDASDACYNIVAVKDGEVLSADILAGEGFVKDGDAVVKGDLLVSGVVPLKTGAVRYIRAKALITARTVTAVSGVADPAVKARVFTSCKDRWSVYCFGIVFPSVSEADAVTSEYLATQTSLFPIGLRRGRYTESEETTVRLVNKQARLFAYTDLACKAYQGFENVQIAQLRITENVGNGAEIRAAFVCIEEIGSEQKVEVETGEGSVG